MSNKLEIINSIKQRILDEYRKHKDLDWAEIAAYKIYASHINLDSEWEELRNSGLDKPFKIDEL